MTGYVQRTTGIAVMQTGDSPFNETATRIRVTDDGAGEYVVIEQDEGSVKVAPEDWPTIRDAVDRLIAEAR